MKRELAEFFWLFEERKELADESFIEKMKCVNNYQDSMNRFLHTVPQFNGYKDFIKYCISDMPKT